MRALRMHGVARFVRHARESSALAPRSSSIHRLSPPPPEFRLHEPGDARSASKRLPRVARHPARIAEAAERNGPKRPGSVDARGCPNPSRRRSARTSSAPGERLLEIAVDEAEKTRQVRAMTRSSEFPRRSAKALASTASFPPKALRAPCPTSNGRRTPSPSTQTPPVAAPDAVYPTDEDLPTPEGQATSRSDPQFAARIGIEIGPQGLVVAEVDGLLHRVPEP